MKTIYLLFNSCFKWFSGLVLLIMSSTERVRKYRAKLKNDEKKHDEVKMKDRRTRCKQS